MKKIIKVLLGMLLIFPSVVFAEEKEETISNTSNIVERTIDTLDNLEDMSVNSENITAENSMNSDLISDKNSIVSTKDTNVENEKIKTVMIEEKEEDEKIETVDNIIPIKNTFEPKDSGTASVNYLGSVIFVVDGKETSIDFTNDSEKIGGIDNRGALWDKGGRFNKAYFIGWSKSDDFANNKDAELFYSDEPISNAFPNGLSGNEKLYATYLSRFSILGYINDNFAFINRFDRAAQTLPEADIKSDTFDNPSPNREAIVYFDENKSNYRVNLNSSFQMNKVLSHWLYLGNGHTIMTNTQSESDSSSKTAKYTHIDLNVTLSDDFDVPEEMELTFEGYFFQPYMVIDGSSATREKMEIVGVTSADKWNIGELVSDTSPVTTFKFKNVNKTKKIILRTILRTNTALGGKRINGKTASEIENTNMLLSINLSSNFVKISKNSAKNLLDNNSAAMVSGVVNGYVKMPFAGPFSLDREIPDIVANYPLYIRFVSNHKVPPVITNPVTPKKVSTVKITCEDIGKVWNEEKQACILNVKKIASPQTGVK